MPVRTDDPGVPAFARRRDAKLRPWAAGLLLALAACSRNDSATGVAAAGFAPDGDAVVSPNPYDIALLNPAGDCNIEYLNRRLLTGESLRIDRFADYAISGWVLDASTHGNGDPVDLVITKVGGSTGWVMQHVARTPRPDVAAFRKDSAYSRSGFLALFPSDKLAPGIYRITLVYGKADARFGCGSPTLVEVLP